MKWVVCRVLLIVVDGTYKILVTGVQVLLAQLSFVILLNIPKKAL